MRAPDDARLGPRAVLVGDPAPIRNYAVIGDRATAALVSVHGSIDWWCPGRFDAPSALARLLDPEGGAFTLRPTPVASPEVAYVASTNVLRTTWTTPSGTLVVTDAMPVTPRGAAPAEGSRIVRVAECTRGTVPVLAACAPRPAYARETPHAVRTRGGVRFDAPSGSLALDATHPLDHDASRAWTRVDLSAGDALALTLGPAATEGGEGAPLDVDGVRDLVDATCAYWSEWTRASRYDGPFREEVLRSALVLKLLDYAGTGALVAAPTTSLPEDPGGNRNWDYRYAWIRDTVLAVTAFHQTGHTEDAVRLAQWAGRIAVRNAHTGSVGVAFRVDGSPHLDERELPHLHGYAGSRPVRVGNAAVHQWQLDASGELVDALHLCRHLGSKEEQVDWPHVRDVIEKVRARWREPDAGIWEMRSRPRHFVVSKVLAWVALDRGVRAIEELGMDGPLAAWRRTRDEIREDVLAHGFDRERNTFVQAYGETAIDAANLLIPILGFLPPEDPRVRGTVDATLRELTVDGLVLRYKGVDDGVGGPEGAFGICSCWLAEVLAQQGDVEAARRILARLLASAGPAGLLSEQLSVATGDLLGNYPQALTHLGIVNAATAIARAERHYSHPSGHRELADALPRIPGAQSRS